MTLEEAIELLTHYQKDYLVRMQPDFDEAIKLLIEAGKRIQHLRGYSMTQVDTRLPGETLE